MRFLICVVLNVRIVLLPRDHSKVQLPFIPHYVIWWAYFRALYRSRDAHGPIAGLQKQGKISANNSLTSSGRSLLENLKPTPNHIDRYGNVKV